MKSFVFALVLSTLSISAFAQKDKVFTSLDEALKETKQVYQLELKGLDELPKEIAQFSKLTKLVVYDGNFGTLPSEITDLSKLKVLTFINTPIKKFPKEILQLKKLDSLTISQAGLEGIPPEINQLKKLKYLNLSFNGPISALPATINQLPELRTLNLNSNSFTTIPKELIGLPLMSLDLGYNKISQFDSYIKDMIIWQLYVDQMGVDKSQADAIAKMLPDGSFVIHEYNGRYGW